MEENKTPVPQVTIRQAFWNSLRRFLVTPSGEFSWTKIGAGIAFVAYCVTKMPEYGIFIGAAAVGIAKLVLGLGTYIGIIGGRDAFSKK
jgi:hypothetical protein